MTTSPELLAAYLATDYCLPGKGDGPLILKIGQRCGPLAAIFQMVGLRSAVFITAYNPFSLPTAPVINAASQARLKGKLLELTKYVRTGEGRARTGDWPAEPSYLALGVSYDDACTLGREFGQNAIVFVGADAVPSLVILADSASGD